MYVIILEGANIPTNTFGQPGTVALTHLWTYILETSISVDHFYSSNKTQAFYWQMAMLWDTISGSLFFVCLNRHDRWNKKNGKDMHYLLKVILKKKEIIWSSSFCFISHARWHFRRMDGRMARCTSRQMVSNALVADQLLAAEATTNNSSDSLPALSVARQIWLKSHNYCQQNSK